jgi:DNA recombination protein RmuC
METMNASYLLYIIIALLAGFSLILSIIVRYGSSRRNSLLNERIEVFGESLDRVMESLRFEMERIRDEASKSSREQRMELTEALGALNRTLLRQMMDVAEVQKRQIDEGRAETIQGGRQLREEVVNTMNGLSGTLISTMKDLAAAEKHHLETLSASIGKLTETTETKMEAVRTAMETRLLSLQNDNSRQLEQMRQTVDEKLQGALEKRLGESFRQVSERLEMVHKGLGEMQTLATGVGDLKKVLTNVKTRGTWGEIQLGALLEQVLTPDQYTANVAPKDGGERVEFAVRLPGGAAGNSEPTWLPIDAKFPVEDYQRLIDAQENGDADGAELAGRQLEIRVKSCASDICRKYLSPPKTTDFAILFLPIEGLFAEVIRRTGVTETIQREYRVVIAGPTTLWSILNSLQMGFRTLAIQKRSSEVWNLLSAVKTEWSRYGDVLEAVQKKLHQASDTLEKARVRSRAVGRKLKDVHELPQDDAVSVLAIDISAGDDTTDLHETISALCERSTTAYR